MSLDNEALLYKLFGVNAELLIDHAWGWEPCTIAEIKAYHPADNNLSSGQVLPEPYDFAHARLVACEMADLLALDLVEKHLVTSQVSLYIGYDRANLGDAKRAAGYVGEVHWDHYGRAVPKSVHGSARLLEATSSSTVILAALTQLFDHLVDARLLIRRINVCACQVADETHVVKPQMLPLQLDLFADCAAQERVRAVKQEQLDREHRRQEAIIAIRRKLGKNALLRGMNLEAGATARERNCQIGGHKA